MAGTGHGRTLTEGNKDNKGLVFHPEEWSLRFLRLLLLKIFVKFTRSTAKNGYGLMNKIDFAVGIGGENGQGIASTGNILALIFARRGLHLNAYNAYQSIIRGGHTFLTIRASDRPVRNMGDKIDVFIPLFKRCRCRSIVS